MGDGVTDGKGTCGMGCGNKQNHTHRQLAMGTQWYKSRPLLKIKREKISSHQTLSHACAWRGGGGGGGGIHTYIHTYIPGKT